jgi:hypothetical protein
MTQQEAERRVKALQKGLLLAIERIPELRDGDPELFNDVRRRIFRSTFLAFRLGVVGLETAPKQTFMTFFGWVAEHPAFTSTFNVRTQLAEQIFLAALEAFRAGALVSQARQEERNRALHTR